MSQQVKLASSKPRCVWARSKKSIIKKDRPCAGNSVGSVYKTGAGRCGAELVTIRNIIRKYAIHLGAKDMSDNFKGIDE